MKSLVMTGMVLVVILASPTTATAETASKRGRQQSAQTATYEYGPRGPNRSYRSGPGTRIYVTKRSWLDGGTEVLPGDRKFSDYAFPPNSSFARDNGNRPLDRQPLSPATDLGGFTQNIPLFW